MTARPKFAESLQLIRALFIALLILIAPFSAGVISGASAPIRASATVISPLGDNGTELMAPPESSVFIQFEQHTEMQFASYSSLKPIILSAPVATVPLQEILESFAIISTVTPDTGERGVGVFTIIYTEN